MKRINHNDLIVEFKRQSSSLLTDLLPSAKTLAEKDVAIFLEKEKEILRRWFKAMQNNYLTPVEYGKLFNTMSRSFEMKHLQKQGMAESQISYLKQLLRKLFRAMTILAATQNRVDTNSAYL